MLKKAGELDYEGATQLLQEILPTNSIEETSKEYYQLMLPQYKAGKTLYEFSDGAADSLRDIAYRCPFTHGEAVYLARGISRYLDTIWTDYSNVCEQMTTEGGRMALKEQQDVVLDVYPNPTDGEVSVVFKHTEEKELSLLVYNTLGQIVWQKRLYRNMITNFDTKALQAGVYFCKLTDDNGKTISSKKLNVIR